MPWLDRWREILQVLGRRKLRTALTALAVAWGIFMLVVLLAAGQALSNGAESQFARDAMNSVFLSGGRTSEPHRGQPKGRRVELDNGDFDLLRAVVPIVEHASSRYVPGGSLVVSRGSRHGSFPVRAVHAAHEAIEQSEIVRGRNLNPIDVAEGRKVAAIGRKVQEALFAPGEDPVGALVRIAPNPVTASATATAAATAAGGARGGAAATTPPPAPLGGNYVVVGVFEEANDEREQQIIYIPISTGQLAFTANRQINELVFTVGDASVEATAAAVADLRHALAGRHEFSPTDRRALRIANNREMQEKFQGLFRGIRLFIWAIGLGTILAGVVGVSNIMLISVKERTRELGVRKAIGATPSSVVTMILQEAMAITLVSGYLGLVAAVGVVELVDRYAPKADLFSRPEVDLGVGVAATVVLMLAGMVAGLFPALRAARIHPIEALRAD